MSAVAEPVAVELAGSGLGIVALFQGYNSFLGTGASTAVTGTTQRGGAQQRIDYHVCTSYEEILQSLDVDTSVSYTTPVYSASAKLDYAQSLKVTEHTVTVVVYTNVIKSTAEVTDASFSVPAPTAATLKDFCNQCGDSWINSLTTGAEYFGTYCFYAESKDEQQSIVASLSGSGVIGSGQLSASVQTALNNTVDTSTTSVTTSQKLLGANAPLPTDDQMVTWALQTFPTLPISAPVVLSYGFTGYETVGSSAVFAPVVASRNQFSGPPTGPYSLNLSQQLVQLQETSDAIAEIVGAYSLYGYTGDSQMNVATAGTKAYQVAADLSTLTQKVTQLGGDPTQPVTWPTIASLAYGSPSPNVSLGQVLSLGGQNNSAGGNPFDDFHDGDVPGLEDAGWRIASLMIQGGSWVDWIQVGYEDADERTVVIQHGGGSASQVVSSKMVRSSPSQTLYLQPGEFITSASGIYGKYTNQLTFTTSKGQTLTWPPSPQHCTGAASWTKPVSQSVFVSGFQGRAGDYLDQMQLVVVSFQPATWS